MQSPNIGFGVGLTLAICLPIAGCSGEAVQQAFSADPQAGQWGSTSTLPKDFPTDLSYPNANLQGVQQPSPSAAGSKSPPSTQQTRWATVDNSQKVQQYYSELLQKGSWQLSGRKLSRQQLILLAKRDRLQIRVTIPASGTLVPVQTNGGRRVPMTVFFIDYSQGKSLGKTSSMAESPTQALPQPGDIDFIGPVAQQTSESSAQTNPTSAEVPAALKTYVQEVQRLDVIALGNPNQPIQRGTFARWLVEVNNRLYQDRPTQQIRLAATSQTPVFKDVPSSNPNFPYVQGLAEAGFIPSPLSGDADQTAFQPEQPLTREILLSWKVPIDLRKILPSTTSAKIQEVWGFKDAKQISTPALSAIFADHNNGELANTRRLLGSALLFQPQKSVTRAEAAATLWFIGAAGEGYSAKDVLRAEQQAEAANAS